MLDEYRMMTALGCPSLQLWDRDRVNATYGCGGQGDFVGGLFFADDGIIDSAAYAQGLLTAAQRTTCVRVREEAPRVVSVVQYPSDDFVTVSLADGSILRCGQVVMATGGGSVDASLAGIVTPAWSYLVSIPDAAAENAAQVDAASSIRAASLPVPSSSSSMDARAQPIPSKWSPNFWTFGFAYDWAVCDGKWRVSGEDHYSAMKPPRAAERCAALVDWTVGRQPTLASAAASGAVEQQYGVYSETPDFLPLVGLPRPGSRVCYLLGCNACGQTVLTYAAAMVPGILGFAALDREQEEALKTLMPISRYSLLPVVAGSAPYAKL
jgi:glycine/D-amino acid oxidase-like deaminating enzyme